ncbi:hypothetical protein ACI784_17600, partial [Geodermatophilus sp. SYSU D01186]
MSSLDAASIPAPAHPSAEEFADAFAAVVHHLLTDGRDRQLARYELALEGTRRPDRGVHRARRSGLTRARPGLPHPRRGTAVQPAGRHGRRPSPHACEASFAHAGGGPRPPARVPRHDGAPRTRRGLRRQVCPRRTAPPAVAAPARFARSGTAHELLDGRESTEFVLVVGGGGGGGGGRAPGPPPARRPARRTT